ncbi:His-Xaa-Ser system radical SAM maturase HxsB [Hoeflea sp. WL0058]|uniref:His-Xaa-Ser system radical SAM maturase HxsB n=1 Tax=Flavimaribacter sediminis TaxID=2865987 RepID=A0AAE3D1T5_9HYPH|nr:His-Xaa-Ser system radical SAM maturase HxsB [Flavimaribacter sediminis]MBW8639995.1 His-Xaa-Ser system radical SAM maturase HxsB [Flavimaribacter sediminis]
MKVFAVPDYLPVLGDRAKMYRRQRRRYVEDNISYVVLVPTLRCNLACSYCQVARVGENVRGFDWTDEVAQQVFVFLSGLTAQDIKIEFQGGEPLLALRRLHEVRNFCRGLFTRRAFVVCTNLQHVDQQAWEFLEASDTTISTSLDGSLALHKKQRTKSNENTDVFLANLNTALDRFGPAKVSALPTLDIEDLPEPEQLISFYQRFGFNSIYLRPVAHYGFARKRHTARTIASHWNCFRRKFMEQLIAYNYEHNTTFEEFYFTHCLRRVLQPGTNNHIDLRSPNMIGHDHILIDYDGRIYPTDEARMLTRTGQIDLSIGNVFDGIDEEKRTLLNMYVDNENDPVCSSCRHQPFCGRDVIDDLARYGTIDIERNKTEFCHRHMDLFDHVLELLDDPSPAARHSLAIWTGVVDFDPLLNRVLV